MLNTALLQTFEDLGTKRGKDSEDRFFAAVRHLPRSEMPDWLRKIVKASREEDSNGIDAVAHTDVGKIYLQIKSSQRGAMKFLRQYRGRKGRSQFIALMVVRSDDSPEKIRAKMRSKVARLRQVIQRTIRDGTYSTETGGGSGISSAFSDLL